MREQIFISYRRDGGDVTAKLICEALKNKGYTVFYDHDSIGGGLFDERILDAIEGCTDFLVVLSPKALDRCANPDDWVRQEIRYALRHGKNIVPVMLDGFAFPKTLPPDIADVTRYNGAPFSMDHYDGDLNVIMSRFASAPRNASAGGSASSSYDAPSSYSSASSGSSYASGSSYTSGSSYSASSSYHYHDHPTAKVLCVILSIALGIAAIIALFFGSRTSAIVSTVLCVLSIVASLIVCAIEDWDSSETALQFVTIGAAAFVLIFAVCFWLFRYGVKDFVYDGDTLKNCYAAEETVEVADGTEEIGKGAFSGYLGTRGKHSKVETVYLPDSIESIGEDAFWRCASLEEVYIGNNVRSIGSWAFSECPQLHTIYYRGTEEEWNAIQKKEDGYLSWNRGSDFTVVFLGSETD
ncbi:MAG: TIR domain-containing protein [Clostridia bacterium]|nr:TIR domain-containing protein [Clostridia bacterium]